MTNAVVTAAADAARLLAENRLDAQTILIENTPADVTTGHPSVSIDVGGNPRALLAWARFLGVESVRTDRREKDVTLKIEGVKNDLAWHVIASYDRSLTKDSRNRFPGIVVTWERNSVSGSHSSRGTISVAQLEVLIGRLGV